jgi:uncharacterized protein (DUF1330 family)
MTKKKTKKASANVVEKCSSKIEGILKDKNLLNQIILIDRIRKAVLQMMKDVSFDEKKHIYTRKSDGTWLQGVSTVSSIVPKDWLSAWGAKEAVKALGYSDFEGDTELAKEIMEKIKACQNVEEYQAILKEAKGASRRKSKEALVDGEAGHVWLESYVKARIRGSELPVIPEGNLQRPLTQFIEWEQREVEYWILSEAMVASPDELYAGTLDGLAMMKTGRLALIDFKFASHISEDYFLQTSGYQNCLEKYDIRIDDRIIIRLPKTLTIDEWDAKEKKYKKVENTIEPKIVDTIYEEDRNVFLHMLPVKRWINKIALNK